MASEHPHGIFRFFDLPAELRAMVYTHCTLMDLFHLQSLGHGLQHEVGRHALRELRSASASPRWRKERANPGYNFPSLEDWQSGRFLPVQLELHPVLRFCRLYLGSSITWLRAVHVLEALGTVPWCINEEWLRHNATDPPVSRMVVDDNPRRNSLPPGIKERLRATVPSPSDDNMAEVYLRTIQNTEMQPISVGQVLEHFYYGAPQVEPTPENMPSYQTMILNMMKIMWNVNEYWLVLNGNDYADICDFNHYPIESPGPSSYPFQLVATQTEGAPLQHSNVLDGREEDGPLDRSALLNSEA